MRHPRGAKFLALLLSWTMSSGSALVVAQQSAAPAPAAPTAAPAAAAESFSTEQLEQLVAPIALYPDSLLIQMMMAATYPLEVVEADRFMKANPGLKDAALEAKLKEQDWDPSVKSMCTLPDVLKKMSENLDWTQDLGDAFLGQKDQLLDTVQTMRGKANAAGNLKTTEQQVVTVQQDKIIVIESASPEIVYVPTYAPTAVYPGWSYPSYYYPPMYPYYPPGAGLISFGIGLAVGGAIWGNCNWGWGNNNVNVNVNRYNNFNGNTNINHNNLSGNRSSWNHDASHRGGVNYKNSNVAGQYGAKSGSNRVSQGQAQARGYSGGGSGTRTQGGSTGNRQGGGQATTRDRPQGGGGQGASTKDRPQGGGGQSAGQGGGRGQQGGGGQGASTKDRPQGGGGQSAGQGGGRGQQGGGQGASASTRPQGGGGQSSASRGQSGGSSGSSSYKGSSSGRSQGASAYSGSSRPSTSSASSSRGSSSRGTSSYGGGGSRGGGGGGGSRGGGGGGGRRR